MRVPLRTRSTSSALEEPTRDFNRFGGITSPAADTVTHTNQVSNRFRRGLLIYLSTHSFCIFTQFQSFVHPDFDDVTGPAFVSNPFTRGDSFGFLLYLQLIPCFPSTHLEPIHIMQDPRFCSACGAGPFMNVQNHLNKCRESKRRETEFMNSIHGIKRHGPTLESEIRKRRQPPDLVPEVRTPGKQHQ